MHGDPRRRGAGRAMHAATERRVDGCRASRVPPAREAPRGAPRNLEINSNHRGTARLASLCLARVSAGRQRDSRGRSAPLFLLFVASSFPLRFVFFPALSPSSSPRLLPLLPRALARRRQGLGASEGGLRSRPFAETPQRPPAAPPGSAAGRPPSPPERPSGKASSARRRSARARARPGESERRAARAWTRLTLLQFPGRLQR